MASNALVPLELPRLVPRFVQHIADYKRSWGMYVSSPKLQPFTSRVIMMFFLFSPYAIGEYRCSLLTVAQRSWFRISRYLTVKSDSLSMPLLECFLTAMDLALAYP